MSKMWGMPLTSSAAQPMDRWKGEIWRKWIIQRWVWSNLEKLVQTKETKKAANDLYTMQCSVKHINFGTKETKLGILSIPPANVFSLGKSA